MHTIDTDIPSSLHRIRAARILRPGGSSARRRREHRRERRRCYTTVGAFVDTPTRAERRGGYYRRSRTTQ